jgi:hypothetical protein
LPDFTEPLKDLSTIEVLPLCGTTGGTIAAYLFTPRKALLTELDLDYA